MSIDFFRIVPHKRKIKFSNRRGKLFINHGKGKKILFACLSGISLFSATYLIYLYQPLITTLAKFYILDGSEYIVDRTEIVEEMPEYIPTNFVEDKWILNIEKIKTKVEIVNGVSPFDPAEYEKVLSAGKVAMADGSYLPGEGGNSFIFAHSSSNSLRQLRDNPTFYLLAKINIGDTFAITHGDEVYEYRVSEMLKVKANDISYLDYKGDEETVILQTCWPIGTNYKRLLVIATRSR